MIRQLLLTDKDSIYSYNVNVLTCLEPESDPVSSDIPRAANCNALDHSATGAGLKVYIFH